MEVNIGAVNRISFSLGTSISTRIPTHGKKQTMADKVRVAVRLDVEHELGYDHYQTRRSQLEIGFQLHAVTLEKLQYLAAAANLWESAGH